MMETSAEAYWHTDSALIAELPGGAALMEWFGFVPSFHDALLERLDISNNHVAMALKAFRMTSEVDADGYFIVDKKVLVTIRLSDVSGIVLTGNASSIISELRIRRITTDLPGWNSGGPVAGDFEVSFDSSYGLEGQLFARELAIELDRA